MIILYIALAIVVLLFMVLIHEFGHYIVGRMLGFKITEFSVGFGKALFSRKNKRGELISLRLFPLGGYCAFDGEEETGKDNPDAFTNQAPWKRILVFLAGVTFNFVAAIIFSLILLCTVGFDIHMAKSDFVPETQVENYVDGSMYNLVAEDERLQKGDVVISINGETVDFAYGTTMSEVYKKEWAKLKKYLSIEGNSFENYTGVIPARVRRGDEIVDVTLGFYRLESYVIKDNEKVVKIDEETKQPILDGQGNVMYETEVFYGWNSVNLGAYVHSFGEGMKRAVPVAFGMAWTVLEGLWDMLTFEANLSDIGGPITTISMIATTTKTNWQNLLILIPAISANLAVFNLLPIPALDGAHVVFTLIEWIRKKPIKREVENMIHTVGLIILFGGVILIDILHFLL